MNLWTRAAVQGAACGLVVGAVVLVGGRVWWAQVAAGQGKQPGVAEVVKASRFEVVDAAGKVGAALTMALPGAPSLVLWDAAGRERVTLILFSDGSPHLTFWDAAGKARAHLYLGGDGSPSLTLNDEAESSWVMLDTSALILAAKGPAARSVYLDNSGVSLMDRTRRRAILGLTDDGSPSLELSDKNGKSRAVLGATRLETIKTEEVTIRPESSLVLFDKDGKVMWQAP